MAAARGCGRWLASTGRLCDRPGCPGNNHPPIAEPVIADTVRQVISEGVAGAADRHPLSAYMDELDAQVGDLAQQFSDAGRSFHLVGGLVRDGVLGLPLDGDIDVTTDARPDQIRQLLEPWADRIWDQGERFGTIAARRGSTEVEITTFRAETYRDDSRKPDVRFADDVATDLARRDFTINAIAVSLPTWEMIDPHGGADDLERGVLRTPSDPEGLFNDDPLRMLRAARFITRFELEPDPGMTAAIRDLRDRIEIVSSERVGAEIDKLLHLPRPERGLRYMHETGVLSSCLEHLGQPADISISAIDRLPAQSELRWAALLGDQLGASRAADVMRHDFSLDRGVTKSAQEILRSAESLELLTGRTKTVDLRRFVATHERPRWTAGAEVLHSWARPPSKRLLKRIERIEAREGDRLRQLPVDGNQVADLVGGPGPRVGEALTFIRQQQFERGPLSEHQVLAALRQFEAASAARS